MSLLSLFPQLSLPALFSPATTSHLESLVSLILTSLGGFLLASVIIYFALWPQVLYFHPKYLPRSRLRSDPQVYTEFMRSIRNLTILAILSYPVLHAQTGYIVEGTDNKLKIYTGVWFACDFGGYLVHRLSHSQSLLWFHHGAHEFPISTPFGLFTSSPVDIFLRAVLLPLLVPFCIQCDLGTYSVALAGIHALKLLLPEINSSGLGLLHTRSSLFFHAISPTNSEHRREINPFTLATSGSAPPPIIIPRCPVNFSPLTTIPDRIFGTYEATEQDPVRQAEFSFIAWRSSKEALGTKARKTQRGGWNKVDKWANDGVGKLQTIGGRMGLEGDVDGVLG